MGGLMVDGGACCWWCTGADVASQFSTGLFLLPLLLLLLYTSCSG
jgi:hypothetical protein